MDDKIKERTIYLKRLKDNASRGKLGASYYFLKGVLEGIEIATEKVDPYDASVDLDQFIPDGEPAERFKPTALVWSEMAVRVAVLNALKSVQK